MKADLENNFPDVDVEFVEGGGGIFDVHKDGELIFSKHEAGRFPEFKDDILNKIQ